MSGRQVGRVNGQSKGETPLSSRVLQRAAVRTVPEKEEEGTQEVESGGLNPSRFVHDFSQVPIDRGGLSKEVSKPPNQTGLPDNLKAGVENLSGYSLDDVRVHYNSAKPAQLQALAYTQGTEIHVAPGQEKHLPHEAWHVVQQMQRRVKPTMQMKGIQINDDERLEREADVMGKKVLQKQSIVTDEYDSPRTMTTNSEKSTKSDSPRNLLYGVQQSMSPVQMINVGWVPSNPANWRTVTTLVGNTPATKGDGKMNRIVVEANNIANAATPAVKIKLPANHMLSDNNNVDMPTYAQARNLTPECDHIVKAEDGGANDYENARMITKAQNTAPATPRPRTPAYGGNIANVNLRIYTPVTITLTTPAAQKKYGAGPHVLATGDDLTLKQTKALAKYSAENVNNWNDVDGDVVDAIIDEPTGNTVFGINIV